jgi:ATP-dependent RNA helicase SUPV3L1/SUV3
VAAAPVESTSAEAKPAEEPAFIEVWRPAGRSERRPHRPRRPHRQRQAQVIVTDGAPPPAEGAATAAPSADASAPARGPRRPPHERTEGAGREKRQERYERQQRMQKQGERNERPRSSRSRRERGEGVDQAERERYYAKPFGNSGGRDKQPDPNSPFAKLAALKQQLEQSGKDQS